MDVDNIGTRNLNAPTAAQAAAGAASGAAGPPGAGGLTPAGQVRVCVPGGEVVPTVRARMRVCTARLHAYVCVPVHMQGANNC